MNPTFEMVEVDVTEWGEIDSGTGERKRTTVFVREMTAKQRGEIELGRLNKKGKPDIDKIHDRSRNFRAIVAVATCCDANGNLIFQPEDVQWLTEKPLKVLDRICKAALKINGLSDDDVEDEEEQVKN
jgi:hypothetical protein